MNAVRKTYPDCDATLTHDELTREQRSAPFRLPEAEDFAIEGKTRAPVTWRGPVWFERELGTGRVTARGAVAPLARLTQPDREEFRP